MRIFSQTILESSFTNEFKSRDECHNQAEMCQLMSHFEFENYSAGMRTRNLHQKRENIIAIRFNNIIK